jgi:hypothetical protein
VTYPHPEGNCTIRVGTGLDSEEQDEGRFITLQPRDGSGNEFGSFACGREVGYEGKEFRLPRNFTCDKCTLQFEWDLGEGRQIHQCADFLMSSKDIEECSGKCLNGGVCVNGECVCRTNFYGDLCQNKKAVKTMTMTYILVCTLLLLIIGALYFFRAERNANQVNPDIDSIIGQNPEPALQGRFGRNQ